MGRHSTGSDSSLVSALRAKLASAPADLYDAHAEALYGYVRSFVGPSTASDVVHDAMWIAIERIRTLRESDMFRPWLYAIARSECVRESTGAAQGFVPAGTDTDTDTDTAVLTAVRALDPRDAEVLDLIARHGFTERQTAAIMGPGFDVSTALAHARTVLAGALPTLPAPAERFALQPTAPPPNHLRGRVLTAPPSPEELAVMGRRIDPVDRSGFPVPGRPRRTLVAWGASAACAAVLVAVALFTFVDPAPADEPRPSPSGATLRLDLGDHRQSPTADVPTSSAPITSAPISTAPESTTLSEEPVTTVETTVSETSSPETTTSASTTEVSPTTTTGSEWSSRRDRSRSDDSDSENEPAETGGDSSGGGDSGGATNTRPPLFTFEAGPAGRSGE